MRLAIVSHIGDLAAGAEHALLGFIARLPATVELTFFLFEDGAFAQTLRERYGSVTIIPMSNRIASSERGRLSLYAIPDSIAQVRRLAGVLRAADPDVVLTNSMKAHIIGSLAAKRAGLPCVNYVHDFVTGWARTLLQIVSRLCAVERMTCSKAVAADLGIARTTAVYPGIETALYRVLPERRAARAALGLPDDDLPAVALVGRIARWKGQDRFIRIAIDVLRDTDAHFVIVGSPLFGCDQLYVPELLAAVAAAGVQGRIHFVPWQNDMKNVYGAIDLACNTSTREPLGRTMIEALASGMPVVCFDDAGACEILSDYPCGTYVPANDEAAFARAVHAYLNDEKLMASARSWARIAAEPYDIANVFHSFAEVIERVAASRKRAVTTSRPARVGQTKPNAP